MAEIYKELFQSNNKENIISKLLSLINEGKKQESLKFLYKLILSLIDDTSILSKNIKPLVIYTKEKYIENIKLKQYLDENLIQTLWIIGFNINNLTSNQNQNEHDKIKTENYKNLVICLLNEKIITKTELIEKLEKQTLNQIGLIDIKDFESKHTRINTKSFEQTKFNLLREESEGYSELISFLFDINQLKINLEQKEIETILEKIVKIIGYFNLDSYRVLDIAIEIFKYSPFNINYIKIFDILNKNILIPIFDFKFSENPTDKKLMVIAAQLINFNYISLDLFLQHINPSLSELQNNYIQKDIPQLEFLKKKFLSLRIIVLLVRKKIHNYFPKIHKILLVSFCLFQNLLIYICH
jgi:THO complex subunit 2